MCPRQHLRPAAPRVPPPLLPAVSFAVLGVLTAIVLPVLGMLLGPAALRPPLVVPIIRIDSAFVLLPAPPAFSLAPLLRTEALLRNVRRRRKLLSARCTGPLLHRLIPPECPCRECARRSYRPNSPAPIYTFKKISRLTSRASRAHGVVSYFGNKCPEEGQSCERQRLLLIFLTPRVTASQRTQRSFAPTSKPATSLSQNLLRGPAMTP